MSDTLKRLCSAITLILITLFCFYKGPHFMWAFVVLLGGFVTDEIFFTFLKRSRKSLSYIFGQVLYWIPCLSLFVFEYVPFSEWVHYISLFIVILQLIYLIFIKMTALSCINIIKKCPLLGVLFTLFPTLLLGFVIYHEHWIFYLGTLLSITIGMDSGAWFFGKFFGRTKLCPRVSPNKTVEGLFGGFFGVALVGGVFWYIIKEDVSARNILFLGLLGIVSQIGDLVQSKIKRQYNIKDSSGLIPGHGGVYDRLDSMYFLLPFFIFLLMR